MSTEYFFTDFALIGTNCSLVSEKRNSYGNIRISDWFNRPAILEQGNAFDELTRGLGTQPQLAADAYHDREVGRLNNFYLEKGLMIVF